MQIISIIYTTFSYFSTNIERENERERNTKELLAPGDKNRKTIRKIEK